MQVPTVLISERIIDAFDVQPGDVRAWDIAWSLAHTNRYKGHTIRPWSVLSHTGMGYGWLCDPRERKHETNDATRAAFLLHDAPEAYISDIHSHLKQQDFCAPLREVEERLFYMLLERFGIKAEDVDFDLIEQYDKHCAWVEMALFFPETCAGEWFEQRREIAINPEQKYLVDRKPIDYIKELARVCPYAPERDLLFEMPRQIAKFLSEEASSK